MSVKNEITLFVGSEKYSVNLNDVGPTTTLNTFLREIAHLKGTKKMCEEGGCGACTVAVEKTVDGQKQVFSVNSCLVSILSCDGWKIQTVESIGNPLIGYHKIQEVLCDNNGTQCGFCSAGMVMNMYALQQSGPVTQKQIENSFGGNLCRCTGYRPILHGFKTLASDADKDINDIEDIKLCPNKGGKTCCKNIKKNYVLKFEDSQWTKVNTLAELLKALNNVPKSYMLVSGNTARGVFKTNTDRDAYIDIQDVAELISYKMDSNSLTLGANVNMTQLMEICKENSSKPNFSYLTTINEHLDLIATVQIRNIGSLAGNLMMKYQYNEFQSDVFLLLETFNALLTIVDVSGKEQTVSPHAFLKVDMTKKVITKIVLKGLDDTYTYATYKIMPRTQNAHAIVNAGFLVKIENDLVKTANIVYGAINKGFVHASKTEKILIGKKLYDDTTLQAIFDSLNTELVPDHVLPDPSIIFRKGIAISLFYKFVLKTCPSAQVADRFKSGGTLLERPVSKGSQEYGTIEKEWPLTQPITKLEALAQTSGQAQYIMDTPALPNEVYAAFVTAGVVPGSKILTIDPSNALKLDGVLVYYDKNDIPGVNTFTPADVGWFAMQEELFCSGTVQYYHQPIGIIVAKDQNLARRAASLVYITYDTPSVKPYINIKDVVNDNVESRINLLSTVLPTKKGKNTSKSISGEFYVGSQYHFHMELQCCKVVPTEDGFDMFPSSQWMDANQLAASAVLGIPANKINVKVRRLGGGFGGKMFRNAMVSSAAALAAQKLRVPVTMTLPFEDNVNIVGKRYPFYMKYNVDVDNQGVIQYLKASLYSDLGVGGNEPINTFLLTGIESGYDISAWEFTTNTVKTDTPANCYARAPGTLEGVAGIECIMEEIAYTLGLEPIDVKLANTSATYPQIPKHLTALQKWADVDKRRKGVVAFNKANRWMKQGLAIVPLKWVLEVGANYTVLVSVFHGDGSVAISHGGIEMGQGINTKVAQVCAYKFGIALDQVSIKPSYSFVAPNSTPTGGSLTSEAVCYAVIKACDTILKRMKPIKEKMTNPTWVDVVKQCFGANIQLAATGYYWGEAPGIQKYDIFGVCATTVQVDILTGKYQILQVDIIEDLGESMSPLIDIGQIEGAFVMGLGYYTTEELVYDEEGQLMTNRSWFYKPPGAKDIPINFRIKFTENSKNAVGVLKSKAVAEPPMCLSVAVPLAIRNALASARQEADSKSSKWVQFDGPTTVEKTFMYSLNDFKQYVLK